MTMATFFINNGICPKLIRKGRNILLHEIQELGIRFLATNNYIAGNEDYLAKQFDVVCANNILKEPKMLDSLHDLQSQETFLTQRLLLLIKSILAFLRKSFQFQFNLKSSLKNTNLYNFVHPFNNPICSISSFVYLIYKIFYLNNYPVFSVANEYGKNHKNVSSMEYMYCTFMDYSYPEKKISIFI